MSNHHFQSVFLFICTHKHFQLMKFNTMKVSWMCSIAFSHRIQWNTVQMLLLLFPLLVADCLANIFRRHFQLNLRSWYGKFNMLRRGIHFIRIKSKGYATLIFSFLSNSLRPSRLVDTFQILYGTSAESWKAHSLLIHKSIQGWKFMFELPIANEKLWKTSYYSK